MNKEEMVKMLIEYHENPRSVSSLDYMYKTLKQSNVFNPKNILESLENLDTVSIKNIYDYYEQGNFY